MLTRRFIADLKEDRKSRVRRAGEDIEELVSNDKVREAWSKTQKWYQEAKGHQVSPLVSSWIKHQPCGKTYTGTVLRRLKAFQS